MEPKIAHKKRGFRRVKFLYEVIIKECFLSKYFDIRGTYDYIPSEVNTITLSKFIEV